jgi:hypothetical protein
VPDLQQSRYREKQKKRNASARVTEDINNSNQKQCCRATQDLIFLTSESPAVLRILSTVFQALHTQ